jgi:hypothetical protein
LEGAGDCKIEGDGRPARPSRQENVSRPAARVVLEQTRLLFFGLKAHSKTTEVALVPEGVVARSAVAACPAYHRVRRSAI